MLAIPLHGSDVAPRFCSAEEFIVVEINEGRVSLTHRLKLSEAGWAARLERLSKYGVRVLLCGGFNRDFLPKAKGLGIQVIFGLAGDANSLIEAFLRDELERFRFMPSKGMCEQRRGKRRRHGRRGST